MASLLKLSALAVIVGIGWQVFRCCRTVLPPVTDGSFLPQYRPVADLFRKYVEDGTERGGAFAVYHRGEPLVDLWGGYADPGSRRPWRSDTLSLVYSCTKGVSAIALAKLVERGLLDYKAEVRQYWPEFGQNGKSNITVEMLLSHQAGLVTLGEKSVSLQEYKNEWQKMEQLMVAARPDFPPGSMLAYQALTHGMYVDALIRRVDPKHRNLTQFFEEEIAEPFDIDFYIGLPLKQYYRAARQVFASPWDVLRLVFDPDEYEAQWAMLINTNSLFSRSLQVLSFFGNTNEVFNDPIEMEVGLGSAIGFGPARSLAKLYSMLVSGVKVRNKVLLPKSLVDTFSVPLTKSLPKDVEISSMQSFSRGFVVNKDDKLDVVLFGHGGFGGQVTEADPKNQLGLAYITNFLWPELAQLAHYKELKRVFYECFKKHQAEKAG